ncbi:SUKH-3 domain-containing protein [Shewanella sp. VB17]|uniref:SUKH-3 domain-containing protein n=1 Tax=Shewanella sp. VB17 TaxID=2739432 RepID=UPI0015661515|nr:SUKH-3 domain-containing protein [Shewanella sp. VB17]NRD75043.1 SUKH-3 domain-containing protein [Shewanella sp. VB17]
MLDCSDEISSCLAKAGWSAERAVTLPDAYLKYDLPTAVKNVLINLYGLTLESKTGMMRYLNISEKYLSHFDELVEEFQEDIGLDLQFYPLGEMSEYGGYLMLDHKARFFFADSNLIYYGENIFDFVDIVVLKNRSGIAIDFPDSIPNIDLSYIESGYRRTYYCNSEEETEWVFHKDEGLVKI